MAFVQSEYGQVLLLGALVVALFGLPLAARRWRWVWFLVAIAGIALAANACLTFADFWVDMHGFLRMWVVVLTWPFLVGLVVAAIGTLLGRLASPIFHRLSWALALFGLLLACAPFVSLFA